MARKMKPSEFFQSDNDHMEDERAMADPFSSGVYFMVDDSILMLNVKVFKNQ